MILVWMGLWPIGDFFTVKSLKEHEGTPSAYGG